MFTGRMRRRFSLGSSHVFWHGGLLSDNSSTFTPRMPVLALWWKMQSRISLRKDNGSRFEEMRRSW